MDVVQSIRNALSGETDRAQTGETGGATSPRPDRAQSDADDPAESRTTNLYRCEPCGTTYVSDGLDSCSQCDAPVERVPTEHDLGLV